MNLESLSLWAEGWESETVPIAKRTLDKLIAVAKAAQFALGESIAAFPDAMESPGLAKVRKTLADLEAP